MQVLKPMDSTIRKMIPSTYFTDSTQYKLSVYAYLCTLEDIYYLVNTFTLEILVLESTEYDRLMNTYVFESINDSFLQYLHQHLFIVSKEVDENREYHKIKSMLELMANRSTDLTHYTILPTTVCNARCFYCFESGYIPDTLTNNQVDSLVDMMIKNRGDYTLQLAWFGGEPLCGIRQIRRICKALNEQQIPFKSSMISNGSLFDEDVIEEAVTDWHLRSIQITFDGTEEQYNTRKNYYSTAYSPFLKVIDNIVAMHKAGLHLVIRLNADPDNIEDIRELIDYLDTLFEDKENILVYAYPLYDEFEKESFPGILYQVLDLNKYCKSLGFKSSGTVRLSGFRIHCCKANQFNDVIVGADGSLFACEHCANDKKFGTVEEGITDRTVWDAWKRPKERKASCQNCVFLPICTDYPNCPHMPAYPNCKTMMEIKLHYALKSYSDTEESEMDSLIDVV